MSGAQPVTGNDGRGPVSAAGGKDFALSSQEIAQVADAAAV